jgi:basic membrane lipoprotein Med (substrate-binding protein (PBP1-ABC) superfamily)
MTKAAALLLAGSLALAACASDEDGGSASGDTSGGDLKIGLAYDTGGRGDRSFNDSAYAGVEAAIKANGGEVSELSPNADASNRADLLTQLADDGYNPVIAVGFAYAAPLTKVAKEFPDTQFQIIDGVVDGAANVEGHVFAAEQGSFLVGAAAALKTKKGNVGFVGGCTVPLIQTFQAGFEAGVEAAKAGTKVQVKYLSTPAQKCSGFNDPAAGKTTATGMYEGGADIVYQVAGGSGTGVFQAAAASNAMAIGVDSDQYLSADPAIQKVIITSMLKRVDNAVFDFVERVSKGQFKAGVHTWDLTNDGVGYATSGGAIDDIKTQLDGYKAKIVSGEIKVPTTPKK